MALLREIVKAFQIDNQYQRRHGQATKMRIYTTKLTFVGKYTPTSTLILANSSSIFFFFSCLEADATTKGFNFPEISVISLKNENSRS